MIFSHVLYQLSYPATGAPRPHPRSTTAERRIGAVARGLRARRQRLGASGNTEAGTTGLEPATSDVTGRRSNQLNYVPAKQAARLSHVLGSRQVPITRRHRIARWAQ